MALEPDARTPTTPPAESWWDSSDATCVTPEARAEGAGGLAVSPQDRFNQFFWRLRQNGLTMRKHPRDPMVSQPLRWPLASGLE